MIDDACTPLITTWPDRVATLGTELDLTWAQFFGLLRERQPFRGRANQPGWAPAIFSPTQRTPGTLRAASALVFRLGAASGIAPTAAGRLWPGVARQVYTVPDNLRGAIATLVVLPLSRHVTAREHASVGRYAARLASRFARRVEPVQDPWRFLELPSAEPGCAFHSVTYDGAVLDVAEALDAKIDAKP